MVLDTNVLVSGLLKRDSDCGRIARAVGSAAFETVYCGAIMAEYTDVLQRAKFKFALHEVDALLHTIEQDGLLVEPILHPPLKDASDTVFLEAALASHAEYLVTGNLKDYPRSPYRGLKIVGPAAFLAALIKN